MDGRSIALKIIREAGTLREYLCLDLANLEFYWSENKIGSLETFDRGTAAACNKELYRRDPSYSYGVEYQND